MKKFIILLLFAISLFCLALPVAAADTEVSVTAPASVTAGQEITVTVTLSGSDAIRAAYVLPEFDTALFELVRGQWLVDGMVSDFNPSLADGAILWDGTATPSGAVCTFTLRAKSSVTAATSAAIGCTWAAENAAGEVLRHTAAKASVRILPGSGVTLSGQVTSQNPQKKITLALYQGDVIRYTTEINAASGTAPLTQTFCFPNVAAGTYDLVITKDEHLSFTITGITVANKSIDLAAHGNPAISHATLVSGDINSDGCIDLQDVVLLTSENTYSKPYEDAQNKAADVNGDTLFDLQDLVIITSDKNYGKSATTVSFADMAE
jgi:hypothetical protein